MLSALVDNGGRVVDRDQLRRDAGLEDLSHRRCDCRRSSASGGCSGPTPSSRCDGEGGACTPT